MGFFFGGGGGEHCYFKRVLMKHLSFSFGICLGNPKTISEEMNSVLFEIILRMLCCAFHNSRPLFHFQGGGGSFWKFLCSFQILFYDVHVMWFVFADPEAVREKSQVPVWRTEFRSPHHTTKRWWWATQEKMICVTSYHQLFSVLFCFVFWSCSLVVATSALSSFI